VLELSAEPQQPSASMEFVKCLGRPEEFYNLLRFQMGGRRKVIPKMDQDSLSGSLKTCYKYLNQTSRSFAAVIEALDGEMRHAVCIFYLVLRALDTLEDDMTISVEKKSSTATQLSLLPL